SLVILLAIICAIVFATGPASSKRLAVGNSEVLYSGSATQADAQALGKALTDAGYFGGSKATSVLLSKDGTGTTVQFVISEAAAQKEGILDGFTRITEAIAPSIGGKPITLKLVDPELKELK